ncbi:hypothetical protein A4D02_04310 [Niastella koreensis]|uniref:HTH merR-type domain-containing protein n=1 Tax=Niastella koreensis TaxID=354356 RepID=A0ABX3P7J7_9BACT|nr:hypothetical protein A4D02_04310 [Niastella koreensis]
MGPFTISQLQQFSGIKAHTIRIWEQRYNALQPARSEGNTRYYSSDQLRRLLNIVSLMNTDNKVSELCALPDEKLNRLVEKQAVQLQQPVVPEFEFYILQMVAAALEYNELRFDKVFSNAVLRFGWKEVYVNIVYPSLNRLSLMWSTSVLAPAQEHFITGLYRQKLFVAIDAQPIPVSASAKDTWLLFLPEDERHELGLLLASYLLRQAGKKVVCLGADVPYDSVVAAVKAVKPGNLLFFLVHKDDPENDQELVSRICQQFNTLHIYMACDVARLTELKKPRNCNLVHTVQDLVSVLEV